MQENINSKTQLFALIGYPIKHSFSPAIHNYVFLKSKINAKYLCFEIKESNLKLALIGAKALGIKGLNVTIPYKEKVIPYLDEIDLNAKIIGAVNTIKIENGKLLGFNTDGQGFIDSLKKYNFTANGKNIFILGAGGAAKAVSIYLAKEKVDSMFLYDIFYDKALSLAKKIKHFFPKVKEVVVLKEKKQIPHKRIDLIVNATGIGLKEKDSSIIDLEEFLKSTVVYDLIYNPVLPVLLKEAKKRGLVTINGLWMLIYQALKADSLWLDNDFSDYANSLYKKFVKLI